jgi:hypothetical protein
VPIRAQPRPRLATCALRKHSAVVLALAITGHVAAAQQPTTIRTVTPGTLDGIVTDTALIPVVGATVSVVGTDLRVISDASGRIHITHLQPGQYTLFVRRIGFAPTFSQLQLGEADTLRVSIALTRIADVLDTIRISAREDVTGFAWRRSLKVGQFITAADIERENPRTTTSLLRTRDGLRYSFDRAGNPFVAVTGGAGKNCRPLLLLDGFPLRGGPPSVPGVPSLDWVLHPDEIGGVEIYANPAQVPARFTMWGKGDCGVIVFWTRERLGIPSSMQVARP